MCWFLMEKVFKRRDIRMDMNRKISFPWRHCNLIAFCRRWMTNGWKYSSCFSSTILKTHHAVPALSSNRVSASLPPDFATSPSFQVYLFYKLRLLRSQNGRHNNLDEDTNFCGIRAVCPACNRIRCYLYADLGHSQ